MASPNGSVMAARPKAGGGTSPRRVRPLLAVLLAGILGRCAADVPTPALQVGNVGYGAGELGVLSATQMARLGELTAFGLAAAAGELSRLGAPYIERERSRLILQRLAAEVSVREAGLDEAALRRRYADAPEHELVVRHLVILSERWRPDTHRTEARARAGAALRRIRAGADFVAVAAEVSEEPGAAASGGLLRPGRRGRWVPEFWEAASSLEVGTVSGVVETEYGFHVLRLEERRPIPFEEVRTGVLGRLVDLAAAAAKADEWAASEARRVRPDAAAIVEWRGHPDGDAMTLATWPGGAFHGRDLRRYLLTLTPDAAARLEAATDSAYASVVAAAARNAYLVARAAELGVVLSLDEAAAAERRWVERAERWAAALGFRRGASMEEVKRAALAALAATDQSAAIARSEVLELSAALRALHPVAVAPGVAAAGADVETSAAVRPRSPAAPTP